MAGMYEAPRAAPRLRVPVRNARLRQHAESDGHLDIGQDDRPDSTGCPVRQHRRRLQREVPLGREFKLPLPRHGRDSPRRRDGSRTILKHRKGQP